MVRNHPGSPSKNNKLGEKFQAPLDPVFDLGQLLGQQPHSWHGPAAPVVCPVLCWPEIIGGTSTRRRGGAADRGSKGRSSSPIGIRTPRGIAPVPPVDNRPRRRELPPVPTLGDLRRHVPWFWLHYANPKCGHSRPMAFAPLIIRLGAEASSDVLRHSARCTRCGYRGATLQHPSHKDLLRGWAEFPTG